VVSFNIRKKLISIPLSLFRFYFAYCLKICDFGTGRAEANLAMTRIKEVTTFNYRSPEAMLLKNIYSSYDSSGI
jgi:hypothetical protein